MLSTFFLWLFDVIAQNSFSPPGKILAQLEKLQSKGKVLYVAAHPDDENTRLISFLVNQQHFRTAYLSLTRGDGGQNLIGNEQSEELGIIRTQELLAARRTDGAEQFLLAHSILAIPKILMKHFAFGEKSKFLQMLFW